jgi:hypothetical protein
MVGLKLRARSNLGKGGPRKILKCKEEYCWQLLKTCTQKNT